MSVIDPSLRAAFEANVFSRKHCVAPQNYKFSARHISNLADVIYAVKEVYDHPNSLWAHARGGKAKHTLIKSDRCHDADRLLTEIGEKYYNYFNREPNTPNDQAHFDEFHSQLCDMFMSRINAIRKAVGYAAVSYGQAQKLINLVFKYLTCYADYPKYADLFTHCHMVIDSIVLHALNNSNLAGLFGRAPARRIAHLYGSAFRGKGWTEFSKEDYDALVAEYRAVVGPMLPNPAPGASDSLSYIEIEYYMWSTLRPIVRHSTMPAPIKEFYL